MSSRSSRWRIILSLLFCLSLALAPSLAEARAGSHFHGGGSSFGISFASSCANVASVGTTPAANGESAATAL